VDGETVGWLGFKKRETIENPMEKAFIKQQFSLIYIAAAGILAISLIVSFLLARHLLEPIKKLKMGTQSIRSRHFDTRIVVPSKDELGQLAEDFNLMAQTLEKYETMRQQWMSDISHELRTPLAVLRGEIEAMQDGIREISPERIDSLHAEILQMSKIVKDLHDLSLAETQSLSFRKEPIHPVAILEETLKNFEMRLLENQIRIDNKLGDNRSIKVWGDADRLYQLFANLLENVVRYTDSPGSIKVWQQHDKTGLTLFMEDTGPGVPETDVEHLFDRFYRVDKSRSRSLGGSGLGLSICKGIMETMGGEIHAENGPSGGLRIVLGFPKNQPEGI
jgi:two-component system sensor histidine kinase BaeS